MKEQSKLFIFAPVEWLQVYCYKGVTHRNFCQWFIDKTWCVLVRYLSGFWACLERAKKVKIYENAKYVIKAVVICSWELWRFCEGYNWSDCDGWNWVCEIIRLLLCGELDLVYGYYRSVGERMSELELIMVVRVGYGSRGGWNSVE